MMKKGAVALIDALGFRGIWIDNKHDDVLKQMKKIKEFAESVAADNLHPEDAACEIAFLSDTIAIAIAANDDTEKELAYAVCRVALIVGVIISVALKGQIPIAYRGVIVTGQYELSPHFLIGQAVDDAAGMYELAQAAIVWLGPDALNVVEPYRDDAEDDVGVKAAALFPYEVPLKGGEVFTTLAISTLSYEDTALKAKRATQNLYATFRGTRMDVQTKLQKSKKFVRACYMAAGMKYPTEFGEF